MRSEVGWDYPNVFYFLAGGSAYATGVTSTVA